MVVKHLALSFDCPSCRVCALSNTFSSVQLRRQLFHGDQKAENCCFLRDHSDNVDCILGPAASQVRCLHLPSQSDCAPAGFPPRAMHRYSCRRTSPPVPALPDFPSITVKFSQRHPLCQIRPKRSVALWHLIRLDGKRASGSLGMIVRRRWRFLMDIRGYPGAFNKPFIVGVPRGHPGAFNKPFIIGVPRSLPKGHLGGTRGLSTSL